MTGKSAVDYWTFVHFFFWAFVYSQFGTVLFKTHRVALVAAGLVIAVAWEIFERHAEKAWPSLWLDPESPANYGVDVLMVPLAVLVMWSAYSHFVRPL